MGRDRQGSQARCTPRPARLRRWNAFVAFSEKWEQRYPAIVKLWENAWAEFVPFLAFDTDIRSVICTTNSIESSEFAHPQGGQRPRPLPDRQAALKCIYLDRSASTRPARGNAGWKRWKAPLNAFAITFNGQITPTGN